MNDEKRPLIFEESDQEDERLWYKDAIIYEVHVRAFRDSNGDGIGDFRGLKKKLDYLQDLGITAIWLLPFYPSPLRDDGYDISDYFNVHSDYGTLRDFKDFLRSSHNRGIKVIVELVLNHTSSEHQWFKNARKANPKSRVRNIYVWSENQNKYKDARIIFSDFESSNWTWDSVARSNYWHRFYSHQPDLNFENPEVHKRMFRVVDFWFKLGVDGVRLDAVPYLYEKENTNCENLPLTHEFLKQLRTHVDKKFKNKMLLAEANQWPEDAVAYMGNGDECQMAFHFPLMPRMFMAIQMEDNFPIIDILRTTPSILYSCQWALFLRNHDELTLEMVTDEERDYMYRMYARDARAKINLGIRRRLAPLLSNDRRKIELMNILLFSLPGTPIIYYGDEIGMGDNYYLGDRNGVRTPMQWGPDHNAGFSDANPHKLYLPVIIDPEYHFETTNVKNQDSSFSSLLWWMRNVIAMRKRFKAFGRGTLEIIPVDNSKVFAFCRQYEDEMILIVVNLSRFSQVVHIDLSQYNGLVPEEVFGRTIFPIIKDTMYMMTLGTYDYYWLLLGKNTEEVGIVEERAPALKLRKNWESVFTGKARTELEEVILPRYLKRSRWFASKSKRITQVRIQENIPLQETTVPSRLIIIKVTYSADGEERYFLPLSFLDKAMSGIIEEFPHGVVAEIIVDEQEGYLFDGAYEQNVQLSLYNMVSGKKHMKGINGSFTGMSGRELKTIIQEIQLPLKSRNLKIDQSNTAVVFGELLFLKIYRKLDEGINPELEMMHFLGEKVCFRHIPPFAGALQYKKSKSETYTIAILQGYVENSGNAWTLFSGFVSRFFEQVLSSDYRGTLSTDTFLPLVNISSVNVPPVLTDMVGELFLELIALLGRRTAEMHIALCQPVSMPEFSPEPFTQLYQRSLFQSMQGLVLRTFGELEKHKDNVPGEFFDDVKNVLELKDLVIDSLRRIVKKKISSLKIRIHGDYHLGQVLYTGKDFIIMDFEGEPARPLSERKLKRSPFMDVAGMIRSFHYVAYSTLFQKTTFRETDLPVLEAWISPWYHYISGLFLNSYLQTAKNAPFVPSSTNDVTTLIQTYLLEKAVYELGYEMNNRPDWLLIPLRSIESLIKNISKNK